MTTMIAEVYDAFREAGASEGKSRAAAEALSAYEDRFVTIDRRFDGLEHKIDQFRSDLEQRVDRQRTGLEQRIDRQGAGLEQRIDRQGAGLEQRIDRLRSGLELRFERVEGRLNLVQWQLALLIGGVVALIIKAYFSGIH